MSLHGIRKNFIRTGTAFGRRYKFAHRNKKGEYWAESMDENDEFKGAWINSKFIKFDD